ncbi:hypothetical protein [Polyangium fumosum]|uniref:Uncharacterized protein n=1 Tax=Polyangium fumosum TaxID=889272 RepID=A0A4U1IKU7_9BACT|nr:hypothetical protein [Polyangium fumosum]TKC94591.1 hypothetical protein E8A74_48380 [Polyangium fumosum]
MSDDTTNKERLRYGGGCRVRWQDDDGTWHPGTVANHGDKGDSIDVETQCRVGQDLRSFPPSRVCNGWE